MREIIFRDNVIRDFVCEIFTANTEHLYIYFHFNSVLKGMNEHIRTEVSLSETITNSTVL